jgi:hypothetical protein
VDRPPSCLWQRARSWFNKRNDRGSLPDDLVMLYFNVAQARLYRDFQQTELLC